MSPDGNVSTTTVIFIPDEEDNGKFLSCRAENVQLMSNFVEDQWKLEVHCKSKSTLPTKAIYIQRERERSSSSIWAVIQRDKKLDKNVQGRQLMQLNISGCIATRPTRATSTNNLNKI